MKVERLNWKLGEKKREKRSQNLEKNELFNVTIYDVSIVDPSKRRKGFW